MGFQERMSQRPPQKEGLRSQTKNHLKGKAEKALIAFEDGNTNLGETTLSSTFVFMASVAEKEKDSEFNSLRDMFLKADEHRKAGMPQFMKQVLSEIANS